MKGFILVGCLIFVAVLSLVCALLLEQVHSQQSLFRWQEVSSAEQLHLLESVQVLHKALKQDPPVCHLAFDQASRAFDLLRSGSEGCFRREGQEEIRYVWVEGFQQQPPFIALIIRENPRQAWQAFHLLL